MDEKKDVINEENNIPNEVEESSPSQPQNVEPISENTNDVSNDTSNEAQAPVKEEAAPQSELKLTEKGEIIIDNTKDIQAPKAPVELDRTPKLKEPISKKKKIMIASIAAATIVVLFCAIFFPCFFYFKGKVMVDEASDFVTDKASGKYFVLKKDITVDGDLNLQNLSSSIDLNGHNLTVNGKLTLSTDSEQTINIGTKNKNEYKAKGLLTVDDIDINTPNADINIVSTTIIRGALNVSSAKSLNISGASIVNTSTISNVNKVTINEALSASNIDISVIFDNCSTINTYGKIEVENISLKNNSNLLLGQFASSHIVNLDDTSTALIYGKADKIVGGAKVAMLENYVCENFENVQLLALYKPYRNNLNTVDCKKVVYVEKLETPVDLIVSEEDGAFKANCARIEGFSDVKYNFLYTGAISKFVSSENISDNFWDITSLLKKENGSSQIQLSVYAVGNFDFNTLSFDNVSDGEYMYLDSEVKTITYTYSLILSTPKNLHAFEYGEQVLLSFDPVEFADYYTICVDGTSTFTHKDPSNTSNIDISSYVTQLGYHSIRVTANSYSMELKPSKEAMCSYKHTQELAKVTNLNAKVTSGKITVNFTGCENGAIYVVVYNGKIYRTTQTTLEIEVSTSETHVGNPLFIYAEGYNYYTESQIVATMVK